MIILIGSSPSLLAVESTILLISSAMLQVCPASFPNLSLFAETFQQFIPVNVLTLGSPPWPSSLCSVHSGEDCIVPVSGNPPWDSRLDRALHGALAVRVWGFIFSQRLQWPLLIGIWPWFLTSVLSFVYHCYLMVL